MNIVDIQRRLHGERGEEIVCAEAASTVHVSGGCCMGVSMSVSVRCCSCACGVMVNVHRAEMQKGVRM